MSQPLVDQPAVQQQPQDHSNTCSLCSKTDASLSYHTTCGHHSCSTCSNSESTVSTGHCPVCSREVQTSKVNGVQELPTRVDELIDFDKHDDVINHEREGVIDSRDVTTPVSVQSTSSVLGARRHGNHCSQHPTEVVRMFCSECDISFCVKCFFQTHKDHAVEDVDEASGKLRDKLNDFISKLSSQLASLPPSHSVVRRADDDITRQLNQRIISVRTAVNASAEQLRENLEKILRQRELDWETKSSKDLELRSEAMSVVETCRTLAVDGHPVDVLTEFKQVENIVRQVENKLRTSSDSDVHTDQDHYLGLVELDLDKFLPRGRRNLIGVIVHSRQEWDELGQRTSYDELENELKREKEQNNELKKEIISLARSHAAQTSFSDGEWRNKMAELTHELNKQLETTRTRYEYDMAKLKEEYSIQLKQAQGTVITTSTSSTSESASNEEIARLAQDHASQLHQAEDKIEQLEKTLAEYKTMMSEMAAEHGRKLERMQSEHKQQLVKQDSERRTNGVSAEDVKHTSVKRPIKTSDTGDHDSQNDIDSVYERNKEVITSPVAKVTVLRSPSLKSTAKKLSTDQEHEDKVVMKQLTPTVKSSPTHVTKESIKNSDDGVKTAGSDIPARITIPSKPQIDWKKNEVNTSNTEAQKSPVRRMRTSLTSEPVTPHFSCNPSDIDAESVYSAYQDVLNDNSLTSWLILGYEDRKIVLLSTGSDYETFKSSFNDDRGLYGFTRIISGDELSKRPKFVLIMWIGPNVGAPAAAKMTLGKSVVKAVIKHLAIEVQATTSEHLEREVLLESLKKAGGANYGTGV